jgi:hypothetical protein
MGMQYQREKKDSFDHETTALAVVAPVALPATAAAVACVSASLLCFSTRRKDTENNVRNDWKH